MTGEIIGAIFLFFLIVTMVSLLFKRGDIPPGHLTSALDKKNERSGHARTGGEPFYYPVDEEHEPYKPALQRYQEMQDEALLKHFNDSMREMETLYAIRPDILEKAAQLGKK